MPDPVVRRLIILIIENDYERLRKSAMAEYRDTKSQAGYLLRKALDQEERQRARKNRAG
jgi:hypothetical protein